MHRCDVRKAFRRLGRAKVGCVVACRFSPDRPPHPPHLCSFWCVGGVLLSHNPTIAVPSAQSSLATGIGTGPGVPSTLKPPTQTQFETNHPHTLLGVRAACCVKHCTTNTNTTIISSFFLRQTYYSRRITALLNCPHNKCVLFCVGVLVPVTSNTSPCSQPWPINPIIFREPQQKPHLKTGFPLRCFQRLSLPHVANQPCHWRDNWHTRGTSIPVLSY